MLGFNCRVVDSCRESELGELNPLDAVRKSRSEKLSVRGTVSKLSPKRRLASLVSTKCRIFARLAWGGTESACVGTWKPCQITTVGKGA